MLLAVSCSLFADSNVSTASAAGKGVATTGAGSNSSRSRGDPAPTARTAGATNRLAFGSYPVCRRPRTPVGNVDAQPAPPRATALCPPAAIFAAAPAATMTAGVRLAAPTTMALAVAPPVRLYQRLVSGRFDWSANVVNAENVNNPGSFAPPST